MSSLLLPPEFPASDSINFNVLDSGPSSNRSLRRLRNNKRRRVFEFTYNLMLSCEFDILKQLFTDAGGSAGSFDVTPPDEIVSVTVQFVADSLSFTQLPGSLYQVSFQLRETFC